MTTLEEARRRTQTDGTTDRNKLRKTVNTVVKWTAIIAAFVFVSGWVYSGTYVDPDEQLAEEAEELADDIAEAQKRAAIAAAEERARATSDNCPGINTEKAYNGYEVVNPHFCQIRWWVSRGCVRWFDSGGNVLGKSQICANEEATLVGQYALQSVGAPAIVSITLCQPRTPGDALQSCS